MNRIKSSKQCKQLLDRALHTLSNPYSNQDANKFAFEEILLRNIQFVRQYHPHDYAWIRHEAEIPPPNPEGKQKDIDKFIEDLEAGSYKNKPYGYYDILGGIPRTAKASDIKQAYFRLAKRYHPDAYPEKDMDTPEAIRKAKIARFRFDEITEAYQTLMDPNQRSYYDQHGFAADALRKQGLPSIFDYTPKYGIYDQRVYADNETTELEDWFAAQGHSCRDQHVTIRQRIKNAYIELRWGFVYHNFPWKLKEFFLTIVGLCIGSAIAGMAYGRYIYNKTKNLPDGHPHKPRKINNLWEDDDIRDILKFYGVRKTKPSELRRAGRYDAPLTGKEEEKRKQNWLDGKLFSERQYESWREHSGFNKKKHRSWLKEEHERKISLTNEKRVYWEAKIAGVVSEIEKFKLDEHIIKKAEANKSEDLMSKEELEVLKVNHAATNMVQLNSRLNSAKKELDDVMESLEALNDPNIKRIEDQYLLPPSPGSKDFKIVVGEANLSILDVEPLSK